MKYSRSDLLQLKDNHLSIDEDLIFSDDISKQFPRIRRINQIHVNADGRYSPEQQRLYVHFDIKGSVIVGCDITGEDVEVPVDTEDDVIYSFDKKEEDIDIVKAEGEYVRLLPTIFQLILLEVPIKVVKPGEIDYPKGDGWEVISEADYQQMKEKTVDPRLAKLKEYKPQDE